MRVRPGLTAGRLRRVVAWPAGALGLGGRPPQRGADLLGLDLDGAAALAVLGLPGPLAQAAVDQDPVALGQLGNMLGQAPPGGAAKEEVSPSVKPPWPSGRRGVTATVKLATAAPVGVNRSSGASVRLPTIVMVVSGIVPSWGLEVVLAARSRWRSGR